MVHFSRGEARYLTFLLLFGVTTGCSVQKFAINKVGDSLASAGTAPTCVTMKEVP